MPVATQLRLDPIHFGTVILANIGVGFLLPSVGLCLLVACNVGEVSVAQVMKPLIPYFGILVIALLLITFVPWISLAIPKVIGYRPIGF